MDNRERLQRLKSASRHSLHKKLSLRLNVCSETHVLFLHCGLLLGLFGFNNITVKIYRNLTGAWGDEPAGEVPAMQV